MFSNSLFTHLVPEAAERYLMEIGRVLRPGGRTMNTMFLLNDESMAALVAPGSRQGPTHEFGDGVARVKDRENPEAWIAFDEGFMRRLHKRAGLSIEESVRYGKWSGREETAAEFGGKDIVAASKRAPSLARRVGRRFQRSIVGRAIS